MNTRYSRGLIATQNRAFQRPGVLDTTAVRFNIFEYVNVYRATQSDTPLALRLVAVFMSLS